MSFVNETVDLIPLLLEPILSLVFQSLKHNDETNITQKHNSIHFVLVNDFIYQSLFYSHEYRRLNKIVYCRLQHNILHTIIKVSWNIIPELCIESVGSCCGVDGGDSDGNCCSDDGSDSAVSCCSVDSGSGNCSSGGSAGNYCSVNSRSTAAGGGSCW